MNEIDMDIQIIIVVGTGILVLVYFGSLARVMWYERKINQLNDELEEKSEHEKNQPIAMPVINGRIEKLKAMYDPKIARLERKRRFILDKLPFIRR